MIEDSRLLIDIFKKRPIYASAIIIVLILLGFLYSFTSSLGENLAKSTVESAKENKIISDSKNVSNLDKDINVHQETHGENSPAIISKDVKIIYGEEK